MVVIAALAACKPAPQDVPAPLPTVVTPPEEPVELARDPGTEDCRTPVDDNGDGLGECDGATRFTLAASVQLGMLRALPGGGFVGTAEWWDDVRVGDQFDGLTHIQMDDSAVRAGTAVAAVDSRGAARWLYTLQDQGDEHTSALAVGADGHIHVLVRRIVSAEIEMHMVELDDSGKELSRAPAPRSRSDLHIDIDGTRYTLDIDWGLAPDTEHGEATVTRTAADGQVAWSTVLPAKLHVEDMPVLGRDSVFVRGSNQLPALQAKEPVRVQALDRATGAKRWLLTMPPRSYGYTAMAAARNGDLLVTTETRAEVDFGSGPIEKDRLVVLRYRGRDGKLLWARDFCCSDWVNVENIAVDGADQLVIAASFKGRIAFGDEVVETPAHGVFVVKLDAADARTIWARAFTSPGRQEPPHLLVLPDGSLVMSTRGQAPLAGLDVARPEGDDDQHPALVGLAP
jgi:outer membrane protein assembly factor BamB